LPTDDEIYDQVVARGYRRRRRRTAAFGVGAPVVVVVAALVAGLTLDGDGRQEVNADGSTTAATNEAGFADTTSSLVPSTTALPPPGCRNSRDPACGAFYWDPMPSNEPVAFVVTFDPVRPMAGEPVTLTVEAYDPEAEILIVKGSDHTSCAPDWGDAEVYAPGCTTTYEGRAENPPRTGPWDPPPPIGADAVATFEHIYAEPGTYTVTVYAAPLTSEAVRNTVYDVYGALSADRDTITITVE
jgi:hypothetical protein